MLRNSPRKRVNSTSSIRLSLGSNQVLSLPIDGLPNLSLPIDGRLPKKTSHESATMTGSLFMTAVF